MNESPSWLANWPNLWEREQHEMTYFAQATWAKYLFPEPYWSWRCILQPFNESSNLGLIASHLKNMEPLGVSPYGLLEPTNDLLPLLHVGPSPQFYQKFLVEIIYRNKEQMPEMFSLNPRIDFRRFGGGSTHLDVLGYQISNPLLHPHLNLGYKHPRVDYDPSYPDASLCVLASHHGVWQLGQNTAADLLEHLAKWLGSHLFWLLGGRREWLIQGVAHDPYTMLLTIPPDGKCYCRESKPFALCHRDVCLEMVANSAKQLGADWRPPRPKLVAA